MENACRLLLPALLAVLACPQAALAQSSPSGKVTVTVNSTFPEGFLVDGIFYEASTQFTWAAGSQHTLELMQASACAGESKRVRYGWSWTGSAGPVTSEGPSLTVTADPVVTSYNVAATSVEYRVNLWIGAAPMPRNFQESQAPAWYSPESCFLQPEETVPPREDSQYGFVQLSGGSGAGAPSGCLTRSTWFWASPGTVLSLNAIAYPGKVFLGYYIPPYSGASPLRQVTVNGPMNIHARFGDGRRIYLDSSPVPGLQVTLDAARVSARSAACRASGASFTVPQPPAPPTTLPQLPVCQQIVLCDGEFDLEPESRHTLGAPPAQQDAQGKTWVFDHWELGNQQTGGQNTTITIASASWTPVTYTAVFVRGLRVSFVTTPVLLKLKIDGKDDWVSYNFDWGAGHKHTISAPLEQTDSLGRRYRFTGWSNGGPADQEIVVAAAPEESGGMRLTANYELLGQLTLNSEPAGLTLKAGDTSCRTPCILEKSPGTEISIDPGAEHSLSPGSKAAFVNWMDGAPAGVRQYRFSKDAASLWAGYRVLHKLDIAASPEGASTWSLDPQPESGGYYNAGSAVRVSAAPNPGFRFRLWEGALVSSDPSGVIVVNQPAAATVLLDRIRELKADAVRNAAGETPETAVAPGSLIAIRGYHLVENAEQGPANPLAFVLQNLTVSVRGANLALVSVAPDEIIAQLPASLEPGAYTLSVASPGQAAVEAPFSVVRNAPGLFVARGASADTPIAYAIHLDGMPVTPENPAKVGDTVAVLGTGFGPVDPMPPDGIAAPSSPPAPLKDPLELLVNDEQRPHLWAGALPGLVGYHHVQFKIDPTMGAARNLKIQVRVNGHASNPVLLPVQ